MSGSSHTVQPSYCYLFHNNCLKELDCHSSKKQSFILHYILRTFILVWFWELFHSEWMVTASVALKEERSVWHLRLFYRIKWLRVQCCRTDSLKMSSSYDRTREHPHVTLITLIVTRSQPAEQTNLDHHRFACYFCLKWVVWLRWIV